MLSFVCTSGLHTINSHFLDHYVKDVRMLSNASVLGASLYEQASVDIKKAYPRFSRRRSAHMQENVLLMKPQERTEGPIMLTALGYNP